ncbi:hypothetical protein [Idiomarina aquatica]|nr:hypothetical protein [Idiomarina aquatica]
MAVFIIVVLSLVGSAVITMLNNTSKATVSEVYGARALFAARSGAEIFLANRLLESPDSITLGDCTPREENQAPSERDEPTEIPFINEGGLSSCQAYVHCDHVTTPTGSIHVRVESIGSCEIGGENYTRVLLLEASDAVL